MYMNLEFKASMSLCLQLLEGLESTQSHTNETAETLQIYSLIYSSLFISCLPAGILGFVQNSYFIYTIKLIFSEIMVKQIPYEYPLIPRYFLLK